MLSKFFYGCGRGDEAVGEGKYTETKLKPKVLSVDCHKTTEEGKINPAWEHRKILPNMS